MVTYFGSDTLLQFLGDFFNMHIKVSFCYCIRRPFVVRITIMDNTVDGRNPAPVDSKFMPLLTGFCTSQVVKDFFHSQHHKKLF